jgi:4-phytase/acid phosphatase
VIRIVGVRLFFFLLVVLTLCGSLFGQGVNETRTASSDAELQFVVYLQRHGVRSPTGEPARYNKYSAAPWPNWDVPPGNLTAHGYKLMTMFGAFDRLYLAKLGLFQASGCDDAPHVTILADSDQRTRETAKAIAEGLLPGCNVSITAKPEGTDDPLFHPLAEGTGRIDAKLAFAAIRGRIGGSPNNLTEAYRPQLAALDDVLAGCGHALAIATAAGPKRTSLFDLPAELSTGKEDHPAELRGPLNTASTLSENLLLEYTEGMPDSKVGWGCVNEATLRTVLQLHSAAEDFGVRTAPIARVYASNLLDAILKAIQQSATRKPVSGAPGKPGDRILFLIGHDTNISAVAGALGLTWILDGRRDDTPPGGALVFELWRSWADGSQFVRVDYTAQTLEQMRGTRTLTLGDSPARVSLFVPGCSKEDDGCSLEGFSEAVRNSIGGP